MSTPNEFLSRPSLLQLGYLRERLRDETVGGMLLLIAAAIALVWANSPWADSYFALVSLKVGPVSLHLDLPLGVWAADGLLAVFFFIVGLELKHELVLGSLSKVREAVVPAAAAIGGMLVPAGIFVVVNAVDGRWLADRLGHPDGDGHRLRAGRSRRRGTPAARRPARVPADARRRR